MYQTLWFSWLSLKERLRRVSLSHDAIATSSQLPMSSLDWHFFCSAPSSPAQRDPGPSSPFSEPHTVDQSQAQLPSALPYTVGEPLPDLALPDSRIAARTSCFHHDPPGAQIHDVSSLVPPSDEKKARNRLNRNKKTYKERYLIPTVCRHGEGRDFRCPAIPPNTAEIEEGEGGRVQCASWQTRDGLLDHLCVLSSTVSYPRSDCFAEAEPMHVALQGRGIKKKEENLSKPKVMRLSMLLCGPALHRRIDSTLKIRISGLSFIVANPSPVVWMQGLTRHRGICNTTF